MCINCSRPLLTTNMNSLLVRRNRRPAFLIHLTLMACLATGLMNPKEVVLCFGDDGHVAIERASKDGRCQTAAVPSASAPTWVDADVSSLCLCGPCVDVALATIDARPTRVLSLQDITPQPQLLVLSLPSFLLPVVPPRTKCPPAFISPPAVLALTSLRSVILLI